MKHRRVVAMLAVLALALIPTPVARAQKGGACGLGTLIPMGFETITVSNTAIGFTTATIVTSTTSASYAYGYVATDAVRYRDDGVNPTAAVGIPVAVSTYFEVCGAAAVRAFRMIRQTTDASVSVAYYRGE